MSNVSGSIEPRQCLGSGSFASVYVVQGGTIAFKEVHSPEDEKTVLREYELLENLYIPCGVDTFFMLPRPYAYCKPGDRTTYRSYFLSPLLSNSGRRGRPELPAVSRAAFDLFERSTYAMSRVFAVPSEVSTVVRALFFPTEMWNTTATLCRLYFGKTTSERPGRFFNPLNFPLDVVRYQKVRAAFSSEERLALGLPSTSEIAAGMGKMLGRLHYQGGCDARDVEFVLGGSGGSNVTFFVIDFNQVSTSPIVWTSCDLLTGLA